MPETINVSYEGKFRCKATLAATGHQIATDMPRGHGGLDEAFSPTDLVAAALGTCLMTVMAVVAERGKIDLTGATIDVEKEMSSGPVRRIGHIKTVVTMPKGLKLSQADRTRLENAAQMCPVKQSLHPEVEVRLAFVYP